MPVLRWDGDRYVDLSTGQPVGPGDEVAWDWSESNRPWAYESESDWVSRVPSGPTVVPLSRTGANFEAWFQATINGVAGGGRVIIDLRNGDGAPEVFTLHQFKLVGTSGIATYAFGLYNVRFAGFIGHGPDKTRIRMAANSVSPAQLDEMKVMPKSTFAPLSMGVARFYSAEGQPFYLGGVGFEAEDQNLLTEVHPELNDGEPAWETPVFVPQPAPHQGVTLAGPGPATISHCAFIGAGRAMLSQPPFEMANLTSQYGTTRIYKTEFDGRRHVDIDPAQPRRCAVVMMNNETEHLMEDVWFHHSNVSRYAAHDENRSTQGTYTVRRFKAEHITDNLNTDPAMNNGQPLGGASPVTPFGWESCNGTITLEDGIIHQQIDYTLNGQAPAHFQMTTVGGRNPQGGRFSMSNVKCYYEGYPVADGFIIGRVGNTSYWKSDGYANTITVNHPVTGDRLTAYEYTGAWPPNAATLAGQGISPDTHYIVKLA